MSKHVSQREFARRIGRSHVWVNRLVHEGRLPSNERGQIPLSEGLEAWRHSQQPGDDIRREAAAKQRAKAASQKKKSTSEQLPNVEVPTSGPTVARVNEAYNRARLAEKTYQAKLRELEYKEASGELIPAGEVEDDASKTGAEVRERLMALPPRVAAICEGKQAREIERIIEEAINETLTALQRSRFRGRK